MPTTGTHQPLAPVIKNVLRALTEGPKQKHARLASKWETIVGKSLALETNARFQRNGVVVWAENAALASDLSQRYGQAILKRLQNEFGEDVKKIWFRVGKPS